jgi:CDP-diacylglycerol--glycerol-3-phosphate 3-phosphatidyltransferase
VKGTLVFPTLQIGSLGIRIDEELMLQLLRLPLNDTVVSIAAGYLNFPQKYIQALWDSSANFRVISSSPQANGFYGSKGISRFIPAAYSYLENQYLKKIIRQKEFDRIKLFEYMRPDWTYHCKG